MDIVWNTINVPNSQHKMYSSGTRLHVSVIKGYPSSRMNYMILESKNVVCRLRRNELSVTIKFYIFFQRFNVCFATASGQLGHIQAIQLCTEHVRGKLSTVG